MLSKWSSAVNQELKNTSFICELHFIPHDVIKTNQEILKDGSIYVYEYEKVHLKKKAVPKLDTKNDDNDNINNSLSDDLRPNSPNIIDDNIQNSIDTRPVNEAADEIIETSDENCTNTNILNTISNVADDNNLELINEPQEFSLHSIEKILETQPLRKNWSWRIIKDSFISFSHITLKLKLICHVNIDKDLKVTIINAKTNVIIDMDVNIPSIESVWQLLNSLENSFFCSGTGCDDTKCSPTCTGILLPDEMYKKRMLAYRCITCRKLRRLIQKRKNKTADYEARWKNVKHRLILERKKLNRVIQKIEAGCFPFDYGG